ncbi:hypothetical protein PIB30_083290, partial [Stylosanthes scabra]|nr:hypothetical protein [Stylosanthes scabra]
MQQSKPRHYTESDVWDMLTSLGVLDPYRMKCYQFLCENNKKKLQIFGMPPENRLQGLLHMMAD